MGQRFPTNRRDNGRYRHRMNVRVQLGAKWCEGTTFDISAQGALLECQGIATKPQLESPVRIKLDVGQEVEVSGRVRWRENDRVGVYFDGMKPQELRALFSHLEHCMKSSPSDDNVSSRRFAQGTQELPPYPED